MDPDIVDTLVGRCDAEAFKDFVGLEGEKASVIFFAVVMHLLGFRIKS